MADVYKGKIWKVSTSGGNESILVFADSLNEVMAKIGAGPELKGTIESCEQWTWIKHVIL